MDQQTSGCAWFGFPPAVFEPPLPLPILNSISNYVCLIYLVGLWKTRIQCNLLLPCIFLCIVSNVKNSTEHNKKVFVTIVVFIVVLRSCQTVPILQHLNWIALVLTYCIFIKMACFLFVCVSESFNYSSPMSKIRLNKYTFECAAFIRCIMRYE